MNNSLNTSNKGPIGGGNMNTSYSTERVKDFKGSLKKLVEYLKGYKLSIIVVFIFAILSTIFSVVGPKILGQATTEIYNGVMSKISGSGTGINFDAIGQILLFLLSLYALSFAFAYIQGFIMTSVSMKLTYNLRNDIIKKINRMPISYFNKINYGEILSRVTNDIDTISQNLNQSVTQIITSIATIIGMLVMMLTISWQLSLVSSLIVPVSVFLIALIAKKSQKYFADQQEYLGNLNGHVEEMYSGHNVVKAFNGEEASIETFNKYNDKLYLSAWKSQFFSGFMMPVINFVSHSGYVAVCVFGGYLVVRNGLPVGDIQAFIQYVNQFTNPIIQVSNISNVLQQILASAERVFDFLDEDEEIPEDSTPIRIRKPGDPTNDQKLINIQGNVKFAHVAFGYSPDKIIIKDFSADIESGQKIAIVGPTGAGKTTIVKLLMRFYDVSSGAILIDGHNIKHFTRNELRSQFGMVLQDTWLYNGSIKDNIKYGKLDATDEEVVEAAKAAQVDFFVRTLPGGYDMVLNEESSNVSQGQKQLLNIARAILADPKILILDEATSLVDTRTELLIQKAMDNLMRGRTSFVIAHRLSTIKNADLILVMNEGDIVEQGTHNELMKKNGFYANLYNSQFEQ